VLGHMFWGMGERVLSWWIRDRDRIPRDEVVRTFAGFIAKGFS